MPETTFETLCSTFTGAYTSVRKLWQAQFEQVASQMEGHDADLFCGVGNFLNTHSKGVCESNYVPLPNGSDKLRVDTTKTRLNYDELGGFASYGFIHSDAERIRAPAGIIPECTFKT